MTLFQARVDFSNSGLTLFPFFFPFSWNSELNETFALYFLEPVHHVTGIPHLKPLIQLNITYRTRSTAYSSALLPRPLLFFSHWLLWLTGNIRLGLKKSYQEHYVNKGLKVGRPSKGLLWGSGQRCGWPTFSHNLWRQDWKYPNDIREPEMRVCHNGMKRKGSA